MASSDKVKGHLTVGYSSDDSPRNDSSLKLKEFFGDIDKDLVYTWWGCALAGGHDTESNVVIMVDSSTCSIKESLSECSSSRNALERAREGDYAQIVWFRDKTEAPFSILEYKGDDEFSVSTRTFKTLKEVSDYIINPTKHPVSHIPGSIGDLMQEKLRNNMQARIDFDKTVVKVGRDELQQFRSPSLCDRDINLLLG